MNQQSENIINRLKILSKLDKEGILRPEVVMKKQEQLIDALFETEINVNESNFLLSQMEEMPQIVHDTLNINCMKGEWLRKPKGGTTVVFIHGIFSSGDRCWLNDNGTYWPKLLANEEKYSEIGIYIYTYKTGISSGSYNLNDVVDDLKERLERLDAVFESEEVVFICHSMGGIIARKFILERFFYFPKSLRKLGLFLLASPSLGSQYANQLNLFAKLLGNTQAEALKLSQNNTWLNDLDKAFINLYQSDKVNIVGKELVEDVFFSFKGFFFPSVVQPLSGAKYFSEPYKVPNSNHLTIPTPANKNAVQHLLLCKFLEDFFLKRHDNQSVKDSQLDSKINPLTETIDSHIDKILFEKHIQTFDRYAFKISCINELSIEELIKNIDMTNIAIDLGKFYVTEGILIDSYSPKRFFKTQVYRSIVSMVQDQLVQLKYQANKYRSDFKELFPSSSHKDTFYDMFSVIIDSENKEIIRSFMKNMDKIDLCRNDIFNILNQLPIEAKFDLIELSSNILRSGQKGGSRIKKEFWLVDN